MHLKLMFGLAGTTPEGFPFSVAEDPKLGRMKFKRVKWEYFIDSVVDDLEMVDCSETASFNETIPVEDFRPLFSVFKCVADDQVA